MAGKIAERVSIGKIDLEMTREITIRFIVLVTLSSVFGLQVVGQTVVDTPAADARVKAAKAVVQKKIHTTTRVAPVRPVVIQQGTSAPQVVTILHGLNGRKLFRMLLRSDELAAIAKLDKSFQIENEIHTNVIAGLALDDGRTIAVWLPEAEAEMPPIPFAPGAWPVPGGFNMPSPRVVPPPQPKQASKVVVPPPDVAGPAVGVPPIAFPRGLFEPADIKVVTREGKRLVARFVGLDGLTGLSVITLESGSLPGLEDAKVERIDLGQHLRLIGPEPATPGSGNAGAPMYVRMGETDATVIRISRAPSGKLHRVRIKSNKLTPANMGGIAINDAGETLGIVDAVKGNEATIVPLALVRSAAKRVVDRQASVPRPWLGVMGEPIGALSFERILKEGWQVDRARALAGKREGILLTSIVPGSPAALAQLRPGDVIIKVNNDEIRNAEEFTWLLDGAGPGNSVKFTIARPEKLALEAMEIKLSEAPDPFHGHRRTSQTEAKTRRPGFLLSRGIEAITLRPQAASHFGANGGLLVVDVDPSTAAFKAGLKPGDVIVAINGQQVFSRPVPLTLFNTGTATSTFEVVRDKQKIVITVPAKAEAEARP